MNFKMCFSFLIDKTSFIFIESRTRIRLVFFNTFLLNVLASELLLLVNGYVL